MYTPCVNGRTTEILAAASWFALWGVVVALDAAGSGPFEDWSIGVNLVLFGVLAQVALGFLAGRGWALLCPCAAVAALIAIGLADAGDEVAAGVVVVAFLYLPVAVIGVAVGYGLRQWLDFSRRPS